VNKNLNEKQHLAISGPSKNSSGKTQITILNAYKKNLITTQHKIDTTFGDLKRYIHLQCIRMQP
jgi:hypothetical protein